MKYLFYVTAPILTKIDDDDLRGEHRWERNVLSACLGAGKLVHTSHSVWKTEEPAPKNFYDGFNEEWEKDSLSITHGSNAATNIFRPAKYYIVHYFNTPTKELAGEFIEIRKKQPGCIIASCAYRSWTYFDSLVNVFGSDSVEHINNPSVPYVVEDSDNYKKNILFWGHRNFMEFHNNYPEKLSKLFNYISKVLAADPALKLHINIYTNGNTSLLNAIAKNEKEFVLSKPFSAELRKYRDRVFVTQNLNWCDVINILRETKLVISPPTAFSAIVMEAAMFGVPVILQDAANPFQDSNKTKFFPEVLVYEDLNIDSFSSKLNDLLINGDYYRHIGCAYRSFVKDNFTYRSFVDKIESICKKRGWVFD